MHEVLLDQLTSALARQLRCDVDVELAATELATFDEYLRSMPLVTVVGTFRLAPLEGRCAVELNPQLATVMVERMLGGPGTLPQLRRLTTLEVAALGEVVEVLGDGLAAAFAPVVELQVRHDDLVFDPQFLDLADGTETVVLLAYRVALQAEEGTSEGIVTLCYPTTQLAPVLRHLQDAAAGEGEPEPLRRPAGPLVAHLPEVDVPVRVRLRPTRVLARDIADLVPGDVLRLDHAVGDPVVAASGDRELFTGHLGQRRRRLAVQVATVRAVAATDPAEVAPTSPAGQPSQSSQPSPTRAGDDLLVATEDAR